MVFHPHSVYWLHRITHTCLVKLPFIEWSDLMYVCHGHPRLDIGEVSVPLLLLALRSCVFFLNMKVISFDKDLTPYFVGIFPPFGVFSLIILLDLLILCWWMVYQSTTYLRSKYDSVKNEFIWHSIQCAVTQCPSNIG